MLGVRHPFTHALYEQDGSGNVLVTEPGEPGEANGDGKRWGRFTRDGRWLEGELRECDPHLCGWVAGPLIANHRMVESVPTPTSPSAG